MDAHARKLIMETYKARARKAYLRGDVAAQVRSSTDWRSLATEAEARRAPRWLWWKTRPKEERRWGRFPSMTVTFELVGGEAVLVPVGDFAEASAVSRDIIARHGAGTSSLGAHHGEVLVGTQLVARVAYNGRVFGPQADAWRQAVLYEPRAA